jgi:hypothetical protein
VPKRQPKPELITPDEVMDSPALQGFDTFLRYRPAEEKPAPAPPQKPMGESPIGESYPSVIPLSSSSPNAVAAKDKLPIGESPIGINAKDSFAPPSPLQPIRPIRKIRRAVKVQDAHSIGEQALYQSLWNAASPETADTRLIRIGYGGMQSLCGLDKSNCKDNVLALIKKLALEVISGFDIRRNEGNTYRVYSYGAILKRRKAAGLEWVIRSRGVQFVEQPPIGRTPIGDYDSPMGESPIAPEGDSPGGGVGESPIGPRGKTPIAFRKGIKTEETEPSSSGVIGEVLRQYSAVVDDEGIRRLVASCRALAPNCTEEEIAYFIHARAEQARASRSVRNLMGFLLVTVPRCFEGLAFQKFRAEQAQRRAAEQQHRAMEEAEMARILAEQRAILADFNAAEEDKRFARQILGIPEPAEGKPEG